MPTPASESPDALGSPVPAYSVLPVASFGSRSSDPIALLLNPFDVKTQYGSGDSGLSVRQMPPPAAAIHNRHRLVVHVGEIATAVMRPDVRYCAPEKVRRPGIVAWIGPTRSHTNG